MQQWLVQDGAISSLRLGQQLRDVGVRANCWRARDGVGEDVVIDSLDSCDTTPVPCSDVTGTVEWIQPTASPYEAPVATTLRVGDARLLMMGPATELVGVDIGDRLTLSCSLYIIPDYEWGASIPDVRRNWAVHGIRQCQWTARGAAQEASWPYEVLEETEITQIEPWPDEPGFGPRPAMYRLKLATI